MATFCGKCGHSNGDDSAFCSKCGSGLQADSATPNHSEETIRAPMEQEIDTSDESGSGGVTGARNVENPGRTDPPNLNTSGQGLKRRPLGNWQQWSKTRKAAVIVVATLLIFGVVGIAVGSAGGGHGGGSTLPTATAGQLAADQCYGQDAALLLPLFNNPLDQQAATDTMYQLVGKVGSNSIQFIAFTKAYSAGVGTAVTNGADAAIKAAIPALNSECNLLNTPTTTLPNAVTTSIPSTTVAVTPISPPDCSVTQFYNVAEAKAGAGQSAYNGQSGAPPTAYCHAGWAILQGFYLNNATGYGLALFQSLNGSWRFNMFADTGGGGPGYDFCSQFPQQALIALGKNLCPTQ